MKEVSHEKKLGRGISALIGDKSKALNDSKRDRTVEIIKVKKIRAGIYQPRIRFEPTQLEELAKSIKENGIIQPLILRKMGNEDEYEIIAGERRYRASIIAGFEEIPAIVKKINNHEALEMALIENIQREDLTILEEAKGYKKLMEEFSYDHNQIAKRVGKSRSHVVNILRLLNLPTPIHEMLDQQLLTTGHARAIINSCDPEELAKKIYEHSLTVRDTENIVREEKIFKIKSNQTPKHKTLASRIEEVNLKQLKEYEEAINNLCEVKTKIEYNAIKNSGKLVISFDNLTKLHKIINIIENNSF